MDTTHLPQPPAASSAQVCHWHALSDREALQEATVACILTAADAARDTHGQFRLVLAGGATPRDVYRRLRQTRTDWSRWQIYFGDERCLPVTDPARNSRLAGAAWLDHVSIPAAQIHLIPAELGARLAAQAYAASLRGVGDFDLVLLGLGEDGHTASLFPGHDWGMAPGAPDALAVKNAPKPPPERVSLSAARLSRARQVLFLVSGEGKRAALNAWRAGQPIPAASIAPPGGVNVLLEATLLRPLADAVEHAGAPESG